MKTCQHGACLLYQAELPRSAASFSALLVEHGNLSIHGSRHYGSWRLAGRNSGMTVSGSHRSTRLSLCNLHKKNISGEHTYPSLSVIPWSLASIRITFLDSTFPFCRPSEILGPKPQTDPSTCMARQRSPHVRLPKKELQLRPTEIHWRSHLWEIMPAIDGWR